VREARVCAQKSVDFFLFFPSALRASMNVPSTVPTHPLPLLFASATASRRRSTGDESKIAFDSDSDESDASGAGARDEFFVAQRQQRLADALKAASSSTAAAPRWRSKAKPTTVTTTTATTTTPANKKASVKKAEATPELSLLKHADVLARDKRKLKQAVAELTLMKQHFDEVDAEQLQEDENDEPSPPPKNSKRRATTPV
jgi:hypothetical protein